jgi:hypothetical protein
VRRKKSESERQRKREIEAASEIGKARERKRGRNMERYSETRGSVREGEGKREKKGMRREFQKVIERSRMSDSGSE